MVLFSIFTLFWQLFVLFACCSGVGLFLRFLLPKEFSLLNKVLFSLMGGLFLVVLIPQNLVYLGVPVRISAWLILGAALVQVWLCRRKFVAWIPDILFKRRHSYAGGGHSPDHHLPWHRSNSAGP